jgi:hypothetical protein
LQHPKLNNFSVLSRVTEGVAKKCGKQETNIPEYFTAFSATGNTPG